MKKNELAEVKKLEIKALRERVKKVRLEVAELVMDKNMNKLTSLKDLRNKKKDISQILTVLKQKQLIVELEKSHV